MRTLLWLYRFRSDRNDLTAVSCAIINHGRDTALPSPLPLPHSGAAEIDIISY